MGKCNLFKEIVNNTGSFFMFSQYTEDLTKMYADSNNYKVVPSKFMCMNLPGTLTDGENIIFPERLQDYFENKCSFLRKQPDLEGQFPEASLNILFDGLELYKYITLENSIDKNKVVKYIGDINIYAYQDRDGVGFHEIYCYIPPTAEEINEQVFTASTGYSGAGVFVYPFNSIMGYTDVNYRYPSTLKYTPLFDLDNAYTYGGSKIPDFAYTPKTSASSFTFNTVLVMYDIMIGDDVVHSNIPMGIYITGKFVDGKISNSITKYVNNADIYDQGTSYGLRICSRFLATPNGSVLPFQDSPVIVEPFEGISDYAQAITLMTKSQDIMNEMTTKLGTYQDNISRHLANIKTSRTNVPYVRMVNNKPTWFINGQNTNIQAEGRDGFSTIYSSFVGDSSTIQIPIDTLIIPSLYNIKPYDIILCGEGYTFSITEVLGENVNVKYLNKL